MVVIMTEWIKDGLPFKVDVKQVDLLPTERQKVIQAFLEHYDGQHTSILTSMAIHKAPYQSFKSQLELSFKPAGLKEGGDVNAKDPVSEKTSANSGPLSLSDWFENRKLQEATVAQGDEHAHGYAVIEIKNLPIKANLAFNYLGINFQVNLKTAANNLAIRFIKKKEDESKDAKDKDSTPQDEGKKKSDPFEVIRLNLSEVVGEIEIPFWGKIIEAAQARSVNKKWLMPLIPVSDGSPELYIDGSASNIQKFSDTDASIAWQVGILPHIKKDPKFDLSPEEVAQMPEFKRQKFEIDKSEKLSKQPQLTHKIVFKEIKFTSKKLDGTVINHSYQYPVLKDHEDHATVFNKKCHRSEIPWDSDESFKKLKKDKISKAFTMG